MALPPTAPHPSSHTPDPADRYAARGASSQKEEVHAALGATDRGLFPGAFCKLVPDYLTGDAGHCVALHADGAGTKSALAWALWQETGRDEIWHGIAQDAIVMNTDDLLCVGAVGPMLASSTIGRNKRLVPGAVIAALIEGTERCLAQLRDMGLEIHSCGGETADLGDLVRTVVVDSTVVARMPRARVIDLSRLTPGLVIIGLASYGQTPYESVYNSGIGSNGLTSARHDLLGQTVREGFPDTYEPGTPIDLIYSGPYGLMDPLPGTPLTVAEALLSPTRTYTPALLPMISELGEGLRGIVHCSGGGQTKILHYLPAGVQVVKEGLPAPPPLFAEIARITGTPPRQLYQTFNMGVRMEVYVTPDRADEAIALARAAGIEAWVTGYTTSRADGAPRLRLRPTLPGTDSDWLDYA